MNAFSALALLGLLLTSLSFAEAPKVHRTIDPDDAYKNNCVRCHAALPQYTPRMNKTIMLHMQQVGNIPGDEARAILRYLNGEPLTPTAQATPTNTQSK